MGFIPLPIRILTRISTTVRLKVRQAPIQLLVEIRLLKFFDRRRKTKLYRQWVERAGLPPEALRPEADKSKDATPEIDNHKAVILEAYKPQALHVEPDSGVATHPEVTGNMMAEIRKRQPRLRILYILLGVSMVILCGALVLLVVQSC